MTNGRCNTYTWPNAPLVQVLQYSHTQSEEVYTIQNYKAHDGTSHYEQNQQNYLKTALDIPSSSDIGVIRFRIQNNYD